MSDNAAILGKKQLNEIALPGAHDAGTFAITASKSTGISLGDSDGLSSPDNKKVKRLLSIGSVFSDWAKTQERTTAEMLADGGYVDHKDIAAVADKGVTVYAPLNKKKNSERDPHLAREGDSPSIAEWRARMATEDAKRIYKDRAATAESINADLKCFRGLDRFLVRTLPKVTCVVFWSAITYNTLKLLAIV